MRKKAKVWARILIFLSFAHFYDDFFATRDALPGILVQKWDPTMSFLLSKPRIRAGKNEYGEMGRPEIEK